MKAKKIILAILILLCAALIFTGCGDTEPAGTKDETTLDNGEQEKTKTEGTFVIELYPEYAPLTVENFVKLVSEGFYDGLTFHRIVNDFMAQGGGYDISGAKKPADSIYGEFANNGYTQNTLPHTKGVISMARVSGMNNSASSEFFIMYDFPRHATVLDGDYAAFGKVIDGMEVIDKLTEIERTYNSGKELAVPVNPVIIKKATILENTDGGNPKVQMEIEY